LRTQDDVDIVEFSKPKGQREGGVADIPDRQTQIEFVSPGLPIEKAEETRCGDRLRIHQADRTVYQPEAPRSGQILYHLLPAGEGK
jgi:hypothetical protein